MIYAFLKYCLVLEITAPTTAIMARLYSGVTDRVFGFRRIDLSTQAASFLTDRLTRHDDEHRHSDPRGDSRNALDSRNTLIGLRAGQARGGALERSGLREPLGSARRADSARRAQFSLFPPIPAGQLTGMTAYRPRLPGLGSSGNLSCHRGVPRERREACQKASEIDGSPAWTACRHHSPRAPTFPGSNKPFRFHRQCRQRRDVCRNARPRARSWLRRGSDRA